MASIHASEVVWWCGAYCKHKMASSKNFRLVDTWEAPTSRQPAGTNWDLCVLGQQETIQKGKV